MKINDWLENEEKKNNKNIAFKNSYKLLLLLKKLWRCASWINL